MITTERFKDLKKVLYSAVIADILDDLGIRNNAFDYGLRPLREDMTMMGRAFTILATDVYEEPKSPYKLELESVDNVKEGEVIVATTNGSTSSGFWGELLTTCAVKNGCAGAIIDGLTRDARKIMEMNFPLFIRGFSPYDSKGRTDVIAYQVPIQCKGVYINPGDIIFADIDGVVVIPSSIQDKVIELAFKKIEGENIVRKELSEGENAKDVYDRYGIL